MAQIEMLIQKTWINAEARLKALMRQQSGPL